MVVHKPGLGLVCFALQHQVGQRAAINVCRRGLAHDAGQSVGGQLVSEVAGVVCCCLYTNLLDWWAKSLFGRAQLQYR